MPVPVCALIKHSGVMRMLTLHLSRSFSVLSVSFGSPLCYTLIIAPSQLPVNSGMAPYGTRARPDRGCPIARPVEGRH